MQRWTLMVGFAVQKKAFTSPSTISPLPDESPRLVATPTKTASEIKRLFRKSSQDPESLPANTLLPPISLEAFHLSWLESANIGRAVGSGFLSYYIAAAVILAFTKDLATVGTLATVGFFSAYAVFGVSWFCTMNQTCKREVYYQLLEHGIALQFRQFSWVRLLRKAVIWCLLLLGAITIAIAVLVYLRTDGPSWFGNWKTKGSLSAATASALLQLVVVIVVYAFRANVNAVCLTVNNLFEGIGSHQVDNEKIEWLRQLTWIAEEDFLQYLTARALKVRFSPYPNNGKKESASHCSASLQVQQARVCWSASHSNRA